MGLGRDIVYAGALAAASPVWAWRLARTGKWRTDWRGRFGRGDAVAASGDDRPTLLIHAVSVGEVVAIARLVEKIDERTGGAWRLVVSTTTDTGTQRARELFEPRHRVVRYPLDFSCSVRWFLDGVRPDLVALTELEVWPNFVEACARRGVPIAVVNGRLSERSFRGYRRVRPWLRSAFSRLAAAGVQGDAYAQRFVAMGVSADRVEVLDSMKWDAVGLAEGAAEKVVGSAALARAMGIDRGRPVVVAGSTGPGEEAMLLASCPREAQLVLVPRKPERFEQVVSLQRGIVRRSEHPDGAAPATGGSRVFLVDTMGELTKAYALADVAIVGRSFLGMYGSNVLEPVALGVPTMIGPHHSDFADVVAALRDGGGIEVTDEPGAVAERWLREPGEAAAVAERGLGVILSRRGATERHVEMLMRLMPKK